MLDNGEGRAERPWDFAIFSLAVVVFLKSTIQRELYGLRHEACSQAYLQKQDCGISMLCLPMLAVSPLRPELRERSNLQRKRQQAIACHALTRIKELSN